MIKNKKNNNIFPIVSYSNSYTLKKNILNDNKGKSGIYRWNNLVTNKSYVGSSVCLSDRFNNYYSIPFLRKKVEKGSSAIYSAILKYGHNNFSLDVLEYCEPNKLIVKEQYYIDSVESSYNILRIAGSRLGTKHSELTKKLLSNAFKGRVFSDDSLYKMKVAAKLRVANKAPFIEKTHSIETKIKISIKRFLLVKIMDVKTNVVKTFKGNSAAAKFLNIGESTLRRYKKRTRLYRNRYLIYNANFSTN